MKSPLYLRVLIRKAGNLGYAVAGLYLLVRWMGQRRNRLLMGVLAGMCAGILLWCFGQHHHIAFVRTSGGQTTYTVTDLGTLPVSEHSGATGINNRGQVVGYSHTNYDRWRAVLWSNGSIQELEELGRGNWAIGINDNGQIVGVSNKRSVRWENGKVHVLENVSGESMARAIDPKGHIVGGAQGDRQPYLWDKGNVTDLGHLPNRPDAFANGINARGQVVGAAGWYEYRAFHAFLWQSGRMKDLGTLQGDRETVQSIATAINNRGEVVGYSETGTRSGYPSVAVWHACLWTGRKIIDLGTLRDDLRSRATAINNRGVIVGYVGLPGITAKRRAFVYRMGKMVDLNTLIPSDAGWLLERADGINDQGQIVGTGLHHGIRRAFLLTGQ